MILGHCGRVSTPDPPPDTEDLRGLARSLRMLFEIRSQALVEDAEPSEVALRISGHLGCELAAIVLVAEKFPNGSTSTCSGEWTPTWAPGRMPGRAGWFARPAAGVHPHEDILSLISSPASQFVMFRAPGRAASGRGCRHGGPGAASYGTAAVGPDENTEVVTFGLVTATAPDGAPVVIGIRDESQFGAPVINLEILAADREAAAATRDEIGRLMRVHDVFRGQVLSFTESEHHGNDSLFLPRPAITAQDIVLPGGVLESIEQHIIGIAEWSQDLLTAGQHLKRGLLLHGPPGTGRPTPSGT